MIFHKIFGGLLLFLSIKLNAQKINYSPEIVIGHRSYTYLHNINIPVNNKIKINNLTLFDTEYESFKGTSNNIFFLRNSISYNLSKSIAINAAAGIKNPGTFFSVFSQYRKSNQDFSFGYSIGFTYQKEFTLEQSLNFEYYPRITEEIRAYISLLAIANINLKEYQRGLQFFKIGIRLKKSGYGLFVNLDQFNNNKKNLENAGFFIKYNF